MFSGTETAPSRATREHHDNEFDAVAQHDRDAVVLADAERVSGPPAARPTSASSSRIGDALLTTDKRDPSGRRATAFTALRERFSADR